MARFSASARTRPLKSRVDSSRFRKCWPAVAGPPECRASAAKPSSTTGADTGSVAALVLGLAQIPVVAVTAYAMVGDQERILQRGFDGYLTKPIDPESFVTELERHLASRTPAGTRPPGQEE